MYFCPSYTFSVLFSLIWHRQWSRRVPWFWWKPNQCPDDKNIPNWLKNKPLFFLFVVASCFLLIIWIGNQKHCYLLFVVFHICRISAYWLSIFITHNHLFAFSGSDYWHAFVSYDQRKRVKKTEVIRFRLLDATGEISFTAYSKMARNWTKALKWISLQ